MAEPTIQEKKKSTVTVGQVMKEYWMGTKPYWFLLAIDWDHRYRCGNSVGIHSFLL
jgi:hypothetical protein